MVNKHRNISGDAVGFIRDTNNYCIRSNLTDTDIEILTIKIQKNKNRPFLMSTVHSRGLLMILWIRFINSKTA